MCVSGDTSDFIADISYSMELHGLAIVTSSGKVAFITGKTARFQPNVRMLFYRINVTKEELNSFY